MNPSELEKLPSFMEWQEVAAFVGSKRTESIVARPASETECREVVEYCRTRKMTICPRGSARSYGDAILNDRNVLLDLSRMNRILDFNPDTSRVRVEAGTRIVDIFAAFHARGLTLPASPTDSTISVGGAMGANVNGKDSWRVGNFGDQVVSIRLMTATGEIRELDRERERELFLAVIGGMGLLGVVTELTLQLQPVPSPYLSIDILPAPDLDSLIRQLDDLKERADFIVVWIDCYAKGKSLGRSVIHATRWADIDSDEETRQQDVQRGVQLLATQKKRALAFYRLARPFINFGLHVQQLPFRVFNRFYYWLCSRSNSKQNVELFLEHNFDKSYVVPPPDILCGPQGFTIQISIPYENGRAAMSELLRLCRDLPCPPATTILRLHRKDDHLVSFSENGY
ncbi:MAG: FAD-binding oxidoreductase, partial [Gammaproteobacteria bacterium]|nr:FAD-binding oxidoreductase [Gammaproteobacteria bacterium]